LTPAGKAAVKIGKNTLALRCRQASGGQFIDVELVDVLVEQTLRPAGERFGLAWTFSRLARVLQQSLGGQGRRALSRYRRNGIPARAWVSITLISEPVPATSGTYRSVQVFRLVLH
jgi:hypothetical protein